VVAGVVICVGGQVIFQGLVPWSLAAGFAQLVCC
jgi:hypothetical protein